MPKAQGLSTEGAQTHDSERFLTDVMGSLFDAVIVADVESLEIEYANPAVRDVLGFEPEELVGEPVVSLYPDAAGGTAFREALDEAMRARQGGFRSEQVFRRNTGDRTWTEMTTRLVPQDAPDKIVSVLRDITERKLWEDALVQSHARLELLNSILTSVKQGMGIDGVVELTLNRLSDYFPGIRIAYSKINADGRLRVMESVGPESMPARSGETVSLNGASEYLATLRAGEPVVINDIDAEVAPTGTVEVTGAATKAALHMPMESGEALAAVLSLDSPVPLTWSMHAITTISEVSAHLAFVLKDAEAEKTRAQLEEQLRQSQKMEAVGRLAGGVAHDFNNILTGITGYVELVLVQIQDPRVRRDLKQIRQFADRAAGLTHQLLAFSRRQPLQVAALDLNDLVGATTEMIQRLIGEDIELEFVPGEELAVVRADAGQIEQVLMNLAVNSRDAMPGGGRLLIETDNVHLDSAYAAAHTAVVPGDYVQLTVTDSGCGMDKESQANIFEPFFTTKEQGKGTGLGLSTVYGIVKQHEGNIWVYSEPGRGTCFKIYLPTFDVLPDEDSDEAALEVVPRGTETVLLVEDEPRVRDAIMRALENYGYTVISAVHPDEARAVFEGHDANVDLLLTDVVMPGYDGRQLHERLCELQPGMPVLFMSGYTDRAILDEGVLAPGIPFIQKPFSPAQLVRKVRTVLDSTRF